MQQSRSRSLIEDKQGQKHGYPSCVQVGRGSDGEGHRGIWGRSGELKKLKNTKTVSSCKSVRWSAVPIAPKLVNVRCEGERGSGPEGADDLCLARI